MPITINPTDLLKKWQSKILQAPKNIDDIAEELAKKIEQEARKASYPGKVKYPVQWTSPEQERYVKAFVLKKDIEGNLIPYTRRGTYYKQMAVTIKDNSLILENRNHIATFVTGQRQQGFHRNTGWKKDDEKFEKLFLDNIDLLRKGWIQAIAIPGAKK